MYGTSITEDEMCLTPHGVSGSEERRGPEADIRTPEGSHRDLTE